MCNIWRSFPADLSKAKRNLSNNLQRFKFECIGNSQTDDEIVIGGSLREFAKIIDMVEDERERMVSSGDFGCSVRVVTGFRSLGLFFFLFLSYFALSIFLLFVCISFYVFSSSFLYRLDNPFFLDFIFYLSVFRCLFSDRIQWLLLFHCDTPRALSL